MSFLLFAGALHINLNDLSEQKWVITVLAVVGVLISMFVFGTAIYFVLAWLDLTLSYAWCLLFGALISPTDPIAVLGILKSAKVAKGLEIQIAGESLFNDGIGVVAFLVLHEIAVRGDQPSFEHISTIFLEEAVGGAVVGLLLGWITYRLLKAVDQYQVEVLLTLALVSGGYALASAMHTSGPIAIVCASVLIGNHGRSFAMSDTTREARGGHISKLIPNRRATQPPAHFHRNPLGRGQLAVFPRCSLLTYRFRYARRSRLEKQPTDLRRKVCYFGDGTLGINGHRYGDR